MPIEGASDHGVSEALYLTDPDGNGLELYRDRPREEWPRAADGTLQMVTAPLDLQALLREAPVPAQAALPSTESAGLPLTADRRKQLAALRSPLLNLAIRVCVTALVRRLV